MQNLHTIAEALDSLGIAVCIFDDDDRTLHWNRSFFRFFPEHEGCMHVGEHYRENLRRFYRLRLSEAELPSIDRYIDQGIARHRAQARPYEFVHRGRRLSVASLPLPGVGRIRIWTGTEPGVTAAPAPSPARSHDAAAWLEYVADGVMVADSDGRIVSVNEQFVVMYGLPDRAEPVGATLEAVYRSAWRERADGDAQRFERGLATLAENLRFAGAPFELPLPDARWSRVIARRCEDGRAFFVHVDISELKRQQHRLELAESRARASEALLMATLQRMEQGVMMVNAQRVVEVCNARAMELLDLPPALMNAKPPFEAVLRHQWAAGEFAKTAPDIKDFIRAGGILDQRQSYERQRPDGRVIEVHSVPIEGGGVLRTYTDITERKRAEARIRHLASHDGLTSLMNREVFLEHLAGATQAARGGHSFAVHYIDLDHFKPINDTHGHAVGDQVLSIVAGRMRGAAREGDIVARMGGDEFAILQRRTDGSADAVALARRVLQSLSDPMEIEGRHLRIGASIGIAMFPDAGQDPDVLLRSADTAMYASKAAGRQSVELFGRAPDVVAPPALH